MDKNTPPGEITQTHREDRAQHSHQGRAHAFHVVKRQFGHVIVRYRGLVTNTAQLHRQLTSANLWLGQRKLGAAAA